jgi:prepilin-type N-terminal cleavage/methylation domain-containing protein
MSTSAGNGQNARKRARGFTLVEMLVVVTITSILALIGISMFRRYITSSRSSEAASTIQAIRAAEETYRGENKVYLNVSSSSSGTPAWYPTNNADATNWALLRPAVNRSAHFDYLVNAGLAGQAFPPLQTVGQPGWPTAADTWYVIQARGDVDRNGTFSYYLASNLNAEMYVENEGE